MTSGGDEARDDQATIDRHGDRWPTTMSLLSARPEDDSANVPRQGRESAYEPFGRGTEGLGARA